MTFFPSSRDQQIKKVSAVCLSLVVYTELIHFKLNSVFLCVTLFNPVVPKLWDTPSPEGHRGMFGAVGPRPAPNGGRRELHPAHSAPSLAPSSNPRPSSAAEEGLAVQYLPLEGRCRQIPLLEGGGTTRKVWAPLI